MSQIGNIRIIIVSLIIGMISLGFIGGFAGAEESVDNITSNATEEVNTTEEVNVTVAKVVIVEVTEPETVSNTTEDAAATTEVPEVNATEAVAATTEATDVNATEDAAATNVYDPSADLAKLQAALDAANAQAAEAKAALDEALAGTTTTEETTTETTNTTN